MKFKEKVIILYEAVDTKFKEQFGFKIKETTFTKVTNYLHAPKDASSLAVMRILFAAMLIGQYAKISSLYLLSLERYRYPVTDDGHPSENIVIQYRLTMLFDIPDERGGSRLYARWNSKICHFPLFSFIQPIRMPYMALVYAGLWIGALGIMLGYKYRFAAPLFTTCYWYLLLIEKSYWNNHSYLFGLVSLLLTFTGANYCWSLDAAIEPGNFSETVPYWNYFILKFQFFILYFMAGVKKGTAEWLTGYSVPNLSAHWVFTPFTLFLTVEQTDYIVVHWFIFLFDLTIAFWMMWSRTRHVAMVFCALFHLMNSRLFTIGMFPWLCLATMPLFYPFNWPTLIINYVKSRYMTLKCGICKLIDKTVQRNESPTEEDIAKNLDDYEGDDDGDDDVFFENDEIDNSRSRRTSGLQELEKSKNHQAELMKTRKQESADKILKSEQDNTKDKDFNDEDIQGGKKITTVLIIIYVTIQVFLPFSHFITKGYNNWTDGLYGYSWDMMVHTWDVHSVAIKVVDNEKNSYFYIDPKVYSPNDRWAKHGDMAQQYMMCLHENLLNESGNSQKQGRILSNNISIFTDVWCSMNGRFVQRMFDPYVDLLQVSWSSFERIPFLMPLLDEASEWRNTLTQIRNEVHSWDQNSDVIFYADFPGHALEKYIPSELSNVTLTILEGEIAIEPEVVNLQNGQSFRLNTGHREPLNSGMFHRILNIGKKTAYYMFTFYNKTNVHFTEEAYKETKPKLPVITELENRFSNMLVFADMLFKGIYQSFFRLPMFLA